METFRKYCISIAGLDSSGGAGLLADIKTMEQFHVHGLGVCTAITYQNENKIEKIDWLSADQIIHQLKVLFDLYNPVVAKIGIVRNAEMLNDIIEFLKSRNNKISIVWDPIIKSSSGYDFHSAKIDWLSSIKNIFLITPNISEAKMLTGINDEGKAALYLSKFCNVLLKGGHSISDRSDDLLFLNEKAIAIPGDRMNHTKHGTGCVLSSAIAANLALEKKLIESCKLAKEYVTKFILSDNGLLGWHHSFKINEYGFEA